MAQPLPRLRMDLDFMPSPVAERPGLLIRDPNGYSDAVLIVPPVLVQCLPCFDGSHTELDIREILVRLTGDIQVGDAARNLAETLSAAGFLHNEVFEQMREERRREFVQAAARWPSHAGAAYPEEPDELKKTLAGYLGEQEACASADGLLGIAAPHVSPAGGWQSYAAAYRELAAADRDRVFVILGTSHYGAPGQFGLTRKPFVTPYGEASTDVALVDRLAADGGPAVEMEDYFHSVEHSIEFQVIFLQHLFGPDVRILPILCGSYEESVLGGGRPDDDDGVRRFLGVLGEMAAREGKRLLWVLGIDMAHMGRRYGDPFSAQADRDQMLVVADRDRQRLDRVARGDAGGFWELVQENQDDLKWCGSAPLYTFLRAVPEARGELLRYEQWNIDEASVVSFTAMSFR